LSNLPEKALNLENRKRELESILTELKGLQSSNDDVNRLKLVELPELEHELKIIDEERSRAQSSLDDVRFIEVWFILDRV
jgi:hypothetical protein